MTRIIGLSGYAQSGKDTVGGILVEQYGFERRAFADVMKAMALAMNPIIDMSAQERGLELRAVRLDEIITAVGWERAKQNQEIRGFLQRLGTEAGRKHLGNDVWVNATFRTMQNPKARFVVTDVRFLNEAQAIQENDGILVRIERRGVAPANAHVSETELDGWPFDYTIQNNGTIAELEEAIGDVLVDIGAVA